MAIIDNCCHTSYNNSRIMQTINISLPQKLSSQVEEIIKREGYASKSEFFRNLIRLYLSLTTSSPKPLRLSPYKKQPLEKVKKSLEKSNRNYSQAFINSVIKGLGESSIYNEN
ncbi:ribbon-helix-helix domain-containing protein [Patescibacteria group bacterium]